MKTDGQLLGEYVASGDEAAFAEIVSRHARMVYRVCLGILGDAHRAEDASQAVFVVLVRKAASLRRSGDLGAWLCVVARNVSMVALRSNARRKARDKEAAMPEQSVDNAADESAARDERLDAVYRELAALPQGQRQAVILRYLEGHGEKSAAEAAGVPVGTLSQRVSRGLARLRKRLGRRGTVLAAPALIALLEAEAHAAAPGHLVAGILSVSKSAAAGASASAAGGSAFMLAKGATTMMTWMKVKLCASVMAGCLALGGVALWAGDGEAVKRGPRDGERAKQGPREGEGVKQGPRDGEAVKNKADRRLATIKRIFKRYDTTGDGKLSEAEFLAMFEGTDNPYVALKHKQRFTAADANKDNALSLEEFIAFKTPKRDGEGKKTGPRDGEGAKSGPRDTGVKNPNGDRPKEGPSAEE